jgi:glutathione S-transferase
MPTLELFFSPGACSRVSLIALEETGAPYQARHLLLSRGAHKQPEYLRLNPKGKVPLLLADGQPLTENVAILTALSRWFPQAKLLPTHDLAAELQALSVLAWFASGIHPYITRTMLPQFFSDEPAAAPRIREMGAAMLDKQLALLDGMLEGREWLLGDWSVADAYAFWVWGRIQGGPLDLSRHAHLAAHALRMQSRPSVQRALAREQATA